MLSGSQIRAARALLGISSEGLAGMSGVGWATIRRLELTDGVPSVRSATLSKIQTAFEAEGIEFIGDPVKSPGVRLKRKGR